VPTAAVSAIHVALSVLAALVVIDGLALLALVTVRRRSARRHARPDDRHDDERDDAPQG
jgi:hypothetical protein